MSYKLDKNEIIIDGWEKGIASSPYTGINDVRAVNIADIPGSVFASPATENDLLFSTTGTAYLGLSKTFTADASTDQITISGITQEWDYTVVQFTNSGGSLPAGLSTSTNYYLRYISSGVYKVATSLANAAAGTYVNITGAGTGTHTAVSTNIGTIKATTKDERWGRVFALDENNRVWSSQIPGGTKKWMLVVGNTLTNGAGNGIAVWQDHLFVFRGAAIDVLGSLYDITAATWTNSWQSMNAPSSYTGLHKTFIGSNNFLYWTDFKDNTGAGRNQGYIGSLNLASSSDFAPGTSSTYTYNYQALDLPDNEEPVALSELNGYLIIGVNGAGLNSSGNVSKLYTWDTVSASFGLPLTVPEAPIYEIVNANNIIYVFCGWRGRVYKTNLSSVVLAFKIPDHLYQPAASAGVEGLPLYGIASQYKDSGNYLIRFGQQARVSRKKILFAVNIYGATALYSFDAETNILQIDAKPLNGYGSTLTESPTIFAVETLNATAFSTGTEILFFGTYYASATLSYTIERYNPITSDNDANFGSYNGYVVSDYMNLGVANNKRTFQQLEYTLDRDMVSGSGLKIYYRKKIGEAWTLLATEDYSTYGAISGRVVDFPIADVVWLQIKVELNKYTVLRNLRIR